MKNKFKKVVAVILTTMIASTIVPSAALAAESPKEVSVYASKKGAGSEVSFEVSGKIDTKSVKSSASWLKPNRAYIYTSTEKDEYFNGQKPSTYNWNEYILYLTADKTGTTNVKYKAGSKNYTTKVTVLPYANPVSSITSPALNNGKNMASLTKTDSRANNTVNITANKLNQFMTIKAASGWTIEYVYYYNGSVNKNLYYNNNPTTVKVYLGDVKKDQSSLSMRIRCRNKKTGGEITLYHTKKDN